MATSRLSGETLEQLSALLGGIARMVAGGSQLSDRELRLLLMGADLDSEPDALNELRRWGRLLRELQKEPTAEVRRATVEAFRARGLLDAPVFLAVEAVTRTTPIGGAQPVSSGTGLKVTPAALEWHDLAPGQRITAELIVKGGTGHIIVESDQVQVSPEKFTEKPTRIAVEIPALPAGLLWTTIRFVTSTQSIEVPVVAEWSLQSVQKTKNESARKLPDEADLRKTRELLVAAVGEVEHEDEAISPDGRWLAVHCWTPNTLRCWDITEQREVYLLEPGVHTGGGATMMYYHLSTENDTRDAAQAGWTGYVEFRNPAFSPNGRYLASKAEVVYAWKIGAENRAWQLRRQEWAVDCLAFSPDERYLAIGGSCPHLEVWHLESRQAVWEIMSGIGTVGAIVFSPDGKWIATSDFLYVNDKGTEVVRVWGVETGQEIWRHALSPSLRMINDTGKPAIKFSNNGHSIGVKCLDTTREQEVELALDVFSQPIPTDPIVAHVWRGQRRMHPWEWANPDGHLPERDAKIRDELELAADRRAETYDAALEYLKNEEPDAAIALLREIIMTGATKPDYFFALGLCYLKKRDHQQALTHFDQAIEFGKRDAAGYSQRGRCLFNTGQYDGAVADFTRAGELEPKEADHLAWRGAAFYNLKNYERAITDFNSAIRLSPKTAWYYHWRGLCQRAKGDTVKADADQRRAEELGYTA